MKVAVLPRNDQNPYQQLLYGELEKLGVRVRYLGRVTPSASLNLLLLPLELAARRATGTRLVHLHWVFGFALPGSARSGVLRRLSLAWFTLWLRTVRALDLRLVWTVHNVLPHTPVFADDAAARRTLVAACDLVLVHSPSALAELAALDAVPRRSAVVPHGPLGPAAAAGPLRVPGAGDGPRQFLFFGQIHDYKGVEDLLAAFAELPPETAARLTVAGQCPDPALAARLRALAGRCGGRVTLRLGRVPDAEVTPLLAAADVVVLPYRRITTSGSAMLALAHGRPLIAPDLPTLAELPPPATTVYDRTQPGLTAALASLARASRERLAAMSAAATAGAAEVSWPAIAAATLAQFSVTLTGALAEEVAPCA